MAEWSTAAVLKTADPQGSVGSNPTPSASMAGEGVRSGVPIEYISGTEWCVSWLKRTAC